MSATDGQKHILAINDSEEVLALFRDLLEEEGYRVSTQLHMTKDLNEIAKLNPDAIILDYMWEREDSGWSLLQMLKMNPPTSSLPIILCTGAVKRIEELKPHLDEVNVRVVYKPFNIDELIEALCLALNGEQPSKPS